MPPVKRPWFRMYTEAISDPKLRRLPAAQRWLWVAVLALARQSPVPGHLLLASGDDGFEPISEADLADAAAVRLPDVRAGLAAFRRLGMLAEDHGLGALYVVKWKERQYENDTPTRRTQLHRDPELRQVIRKRDDDRCRYCGRVVNWNDRRGPLAGTYDHVDPRGDGPGNLVVCCRGCNSGKGSRTPEEAGMVLLPAPGDHDNGTRSEPRSGPRSGIDDEPRSKAGSDLNATQAFSRARATETETEKTSPLSPPSGGNDPDEAQVAHTPEFEAWWADEGDGGGQEAKAAAFMAWQRLTASERRRRRRRTQVPADWQPTEGQRTQLEAKHPGVDLGRELERFRNHHIAKGNAFADIGRAFANWVSNAEGYGNVTPLRRAGPKAVVLAAPREYELLDRYDPEAWR